MRDKKRIVAALLLCVFLISTGAIAVIAHVRRTTFNPLGEVVAVEEGERSDVVMQLEIILGSDNLEFIPGLPGI